MTIATKKGDKGWTSLYGGKRVEKSALRVEAYGEVDELNSALGFARALNEKGGETERILQRLQKELMGLGAVLAAEPGTRAAERVEGVSPTWTVQMEQEIAVLEERLLELRQFILPGGTPAGAALQLARALARRAERRVVALSQQEAVPEEVLPYLNRLSDLLFMLARAANHEAGTEEEAYCIPKA